jgi:hypothetical protein
MTTTWSAPRIEYPDAELVATLYLTAALATIAPEPDYAAGAVVAASYPPAAPAARHVRLRRSGGTARFPNDYPRLDVQVRHEDMVGRMDLALLVRRLMLECKGVRFDDAALPFAVTLGEPAEFTGPGRFPDPDNQGGELILFTIEVPMRGRTPAP